MRHHVEHRIDLLDAALRGPRRVADDRLAADAGDPRESRPSGLTSRIASASPGASRSITSRVPSGVWSRGANPVPPVVTISPAKPSVISISAAATRSDPSAVTRCSTTSKPSAASRSTSARPPASSRTPWKTPSLTVSTLAARPTDAGSLMPVRRYRIMIIPSVSASCGSTRQPCRYGSPRAVWDGRRRRRSRPAPVRRPTPAPVSVHTLYTNRPPGRTSAAPAASIAAAARRALDVGRARPATARRRGGAVRPRPLHGASISTASKIPARNGGAVPSATTTEPLVPRRAHVVDDEPERDAAADRRPRHRLRWRRARSPSHRARRTRRAHAHPASPRPRPRPIATTGPGRSRRRVR